MSGGESLRGLLQGLSAQLQRLADTGSEVEDAVGLTIRRGTPAAAEAGTLQKLDNLVQSLRGLATYVDRLSREVAEDQRVDATEAVAAVDQKSLAAILAGREQRPVESGNADFF